jgi:tetratricopeptide (TPR) repeat protein
MPDRMKPSRLLQRLEAEIAGARSPLEADCKRAERAAYLARVGRVDEARGVAEAIRRTYGGSPSAQISSWIHLVLGLAEHFSDMGPGARDRILRAHALSSATNLTKLQALSAAWLAHMDYLQVNVTSMVEHAAESLRLADEDDHSTRSRAGLVVAQAYHLAGRPDVALIWYGRVRHHASNEGDEAALSALMHNMAWLRAQELRVEGWKQSQSMLDRGHALLGAQSAANFDSMIGVASLQSLIPILRAQVYAARGQFGEALSLYETNLGAAVEEGMGRLHADLLADRAWCCANLGLLRDAQAGAVAAEALIDSNGQFDDRAMAHGRLAQVFAILREEEKAEIHRTLAAAAFAGHEALQTEILRLLEGKAETARR